MPVGASAGISPAEVVMAEQSGSPFAALLRQQRTGARMTQHDLAEAAGLSERAVSDLERGLVGKPRKETVSLLESEYPAHAHTFQVSTSDANSNSPATQLIASAVGGVGMYAAPSNPATQLNPNVLAPAGGDQPHNNLQPYLTCYFNIALQGVYPPRT